MEGRDLYLSRHISLVTFITGVIMGQVDIRVGSVGGTAMLSVNVFDRTNLSGLHKKIAEAAEKGVSASVEDTVEWIKDEVINGGNYVGHQYYPDIKPVTKRIKAKKGQTHVLISTSNYLSSWDGKASGLKGVITGGGQDYAADLYKRGWKIDLLWKAMHAKESEKIIKKAIEKAV